jgi:hypothetical protein
MKSYFALSPAEIAEHYLASKGDPSCLPDTASVLVEDVRRYLQIHGLNHRLEDDIEIAQAAVQLAREAMVQAPPATEHEAAYVAAVQQGTSDAELAAHVAGLDMHRYAAERHRLLGSQGLVDFLQGR